MKGTPYKGLVKIKNRLENYRKKVKFLSKPSTRFLVTKIHPFDCYEILASNKPIEFIELGPLWLLNGVPTLECTETMPRTAEGWKRLKEAKEK